MTMRIGLGFLLAGAMTVTAQAQPVAQFSAVSYRGEPGPAAPANQFRNPVIPGFQPDPSIVRVGKDFYLVNSTFAWWPGIPVYHSRDLVNWRLLTNAIDRPGQLPIKDLGTNRAVFAPTISHYGGLFRILNTCIGCGGNFMVTAKRPEGPWSDPIWLDFPGIDPSLFVDDDGRAWIVHNAPPEGGSQYDGHMAVWLQQIDLAAGKMIGPRRQIVNGGVNPADKPIWVEGPHLFKHRDWYYLSPAEGGTEVNHAQTIFRSAKVEGPYLPGPVNPILTQRDLPRERPDRVEDTGHGDMVELPDGSWWMVFLATRPFAGKSTLMGRETFLLPVTWKDGWPLVLPKGAPVPMQLARPKLPAGPKADWSRWDDRFTTRALSPEWLRLRSPVADSWYRTGKGLALTARADAPGSFQGQPAFLGRRLRHQTATVTTSLRFTPERDGDFAGLMAFANEEHFLAAGIAGTGSNRRIELRERRNKDQPVQGQAIASRPLASSGAVELRMRIDGGLARIDWRPTGSRDWQVLAATVDIEHMAQIHAGLFTGAVVGPYAQRGG